MAPLPFSEYFSSWHHSLSVSTFPLGTQSLGTKSLSTSSFQLGAQSFGTKSLSVFEGEAAVLLLVSCLAQKAVAFAATACTNANAAAAKCGLRRQHATHEMKEGIAKANIRCKSYDQA